VIDLTDVTVSFGTIDALSGIDFHVEEGAAGDLVEEPVAEEGTAAVAS